jgi:DNA-binding XRE family transcriptional regulator
MVYNDNKEVKEMNKLAKLRGKFNISQKGLAEELGVSRQTINNFENGKRCKPELVTEICNKFNVTPCELLGVENLIYKPQNKEDFKRFIDDLVKECGKWD